MDSLGKFVRSGGSLTNRYGSVLRYDSKASMFTVSVPCVRCGGVLEPYVNGTPINTKCLSCGGVSPFEFVVDPETNCVIEDYVATTAQLVSLFVVSSLRVNINRALSKTVSFDDRLTALCVDGDEFDRDLPHVSITDDEGNFTLKFHCAHYSIDITDGLDGLCECSNFLYGIYLSKFERPWEHKSIKSDVHFFEAFYDYATFLLSTMGTERMTGMLNHLLGCNYRLNCSSRGIQSITFADNSTLFLPIGDV